MDQSAEATFAGLISGFPSITSQTPADTHDAMDCSASNKLNRRNALGSADLQELVRQSMRTDLDNLFHDHGWHLYVVWVQIIRATSVPSASTCLDLPVTEAFRALHASITTENGPYWVSRLALVRLTTFTDLIASTIRDDRKRKRLPAKVGSRIVGTAIDLYHGASAHWGVTRENSEKIRRMANRWRILAQESPLLLLVYTEKVDKMVRDLSVRLATLKTLAREVLKLMPAKLKAAAADFLRMVQITVQRNYDAEQMLAEFTQFHARHTEV
ncbi:hypothetical protein PG999_005458 [Apiospora kogelbergensis]|uniref:Uncharacterized protein n=1 Tax=Apiospora kogelbergensis TaxID=1337665 RepID=A0AAW0QR25_9PEZI